MAAGEITVDAKQLKTYSADIKNNYKNIFSYLGEAKTAVKNLKSTWTGDAANEFYAKFNSIEGKCEETLAVVDNYARTLSETSDVYTANEKKVSESTSKLKINMK